MSEQVLAGYRRWLLKMANVMLPYATEADRQDLAQEGHIAMWKALRTFDPSKGALPAWLTKAAKMRMHDVVRRGVLTGMPEARGRRRVDAIPFDATEQGEWMEAFASGPSWLESVELAYHHGEIAQALDNLTSQQREYVVRRFWGGQTHKELSEHFGFNVSGIWRHAKPKLARDLAHLAAA